MNNLSVKVQEIIFAISELEADETTKNKLADLVMEVFSDKNLSDQEVFMQIADIFNRLSQELSVMARVGDQFVAEVAVKLDQMDDNN